MTADGFLVCLAVPALIGLWAVDITEDALCFHVDAEARLSRNVRITNDVILASVSMTIDSQEVENLGSDVGLRIHREDSYVIGDVFVGVTKVVPLLSMSRAFDLGFV